MRDNVAWNCAPFDIKFVVIVRKAIWQNRGLKRDLYPLEIESAGVREQSGK